jgi:hypothetical protein
LSTSFHHHPDGWIFLRGARGDYRATPEQFAADLAELGATAYEGLPEGSQERMFREDRPDDDGKRRFVHAVFVDGNQRGGEMPWSAGQQYLLHYFDLLQLQLARETKPPTLEQVRAQKLFEVNVAFENAAAQMTASYPPSERLTWPIQEAEATAWQSSKLAATPFIDALAKARGIAREDLLQRALAKATAWRAAAAQLVGTRQRLEEEVLMAPHEEALAEVAPVYELPAAARA